MKSRLEDFYNKEVVSKFKDDFKLKNIHLVPKVKKVVVNIGVKDAVQDSKVLKDIENALTMISGQKAVRTKAKKSIAGFKLRKGVQIGVMATLRGRKMYEFLDKLINISLPCTRDFRGLKAKFDGNGNFNLGIKDWMIFPEIDFDKVESSRGVNVTVVTTSSKDELAKGLLSRLGMPFIENKVGG